MLVALSSSANTYIPTISSLSASLQGLLPSEIDDSQKKRNQSLPIPKKPPYDDPQLEGGTKSINPQAPSPTTEKSFDQTSHFPRHLRAKNTRHHLRKHTPTGNMLTKKWKKCITDLKRAEEIRTICEKNLSNKTSDLMSCQLDGNIQKKQTEQLKDENTIQNGKLKSLQQIIDDLLNDLEQSTQELTTNREEVRQTEEQKQAAEQNTTSTNSKLSRCEQNTQTQKEQIERLRTNILESESKIKDKESREFLGIDGLSFGVGVAAGGGIAGTLVGAACFLSKHCGKKRSSLPPAYKTETPSLFNPSGDPKTRSSEELNSLPGERQHFLQRTDRDPTPATTLLQTSFL